MIFTVVVVGCFPLSIQQCLRSSFQQYRCFGETDESSAFNQHCTYHYDVIVQFLLFTMHLFLAIKTLK